eukprot:1160157-Pelagomonas_calceolata.AAC.2
MISVIDGQHLRLNRRAKIFSRHVLEALPTSCGLYLRLPGQVWLDRAQPQSGVRARHSLVYGTCNGTLLSSLDFRLVPCWPVHELQSKRNGPKTILTACCISDALVLGGPLRQEARKETSGPAQLVGFGSTWLQCTSSPAHSHSLQENDLRKKMISHLRTSTSKASAGFVLPAKARLVISVGGIPCFSCCASN